MTDPACPFTSIAKIDTHAARILALAFGKASNDTSNRTVISALRMAALIEGRHLWHYGRWLDGRHFEGWYDDPSGELFPDESLESLKTLAREWLHADQLLEAMIEDDTVPR